MGKINLEVVSKKQQKIDNGGGCGKGCRGMAGVATVAVIAACVFHGGRGVIIQRFFFLGLTSTLYELSNGRTLICQ